MSDCPHPDFVGDLEVLRISTEGEPMRFQAELTIVCSECKLPMRFLDVGRRDLTQLVTQFAIQPCDKRSVWQ